MIAFRYAAADDVVLLFAWANEKSTRLNSFNQSQVNFNDHVQWFTGKISSDRCKIYIFTNEHGVPVGQVRIENEFNSTEAIISISVSESQRGKGYAASMISMATDDFLQKNEIQSIFAWVFVSNLISLKSFFKAGYSIVEQKIIKEIPAYILCKKKILCWLILL